MLPTILIEARIKNYSVDFIVSTADVLKYTSDKNSITFIDKNVAALYPELNKDNFIQVVCDEDAKTLDGASKIFSTLVEKKCNTKTKLIAIGGGILQDLIGYCASTYCRGIEYIFVPTTLLAQADSCIGGKTSINHSSRKNILGTFWPPSKIIICTDFLKTLSKQDYISGLGEIYKFHILQNKIKHFENNDSIQNKIFDGLNYKKSIILRDEFDKGDRKFLNFGHTFGHALEITSNHKIPHGIAVIIGCMIAIRVSNKLRYIVPDYEFAFDLGKKLIKESGIQLQKSWFDFDVLKEIVKSDKKSEGNITMVLINRTPFLTNVENDDILSETLRKVHESI